MTDVQQQVQAALEALVEGGAETGLQVAAYHNGEQVVDAVVGAADSETGRPVTSDTPYFGTSVGKGMTSTVVHVLVERGAFGYDTRIAELWPEFGTHGKETATVEHALTHAVGVPALPVETTPEDLCDWQKMTDIIANAKPWWEPGTKMGYHPQTFGYIIGEIVLRATGKPIDQVLKEEVAGPLGIDRELFFAVPDSEVGRLAKLEEPQFDWSQQAGDAGGEGDAPQEMPDIPFFRVVDGFTPAPMAAMPSAEFCNRADVLAANIPAGGTMTARAIAKMLAALLGEVGGVRLVSQETFEKATAEHRAEYDEVNGFPGRRALGYDLGFQLGPDSPTMFGNAGACGTAAYAEPTLGLTIALNKTRVSYGDFSAFSQVASIIAKAYE
jgi:CubicO group peptidase (beta-lactamase class C family)